MRIALTGASGFVGRQVAEAAAGEGLGVTSLVRSERAAEPLRRHGGQAVVVSGLRAEELAPAFQGAEAVIHLAQIGSETRDATYRTVNVEGTSQVVQAAERAGVRRLVMLSGLGVASYGMNPRTTNRYFLSKLQAERALLQGSREAVVFRPSYIVGPGDGLVADLLSQMRSGIVEQVGEGGYRMQPIAVRDAAAAVLAAARADRAGGVFFADRPAHRVFDLVGPEPIALRDLVDRLAAIAVRLGERLAFSVRQVAVEEADRQAAGEGWRGLPADELDCLLCDEVADPAPLERLLGRPLMPLDVALEAAVHAALSRHTAS